MSRGVFIWVLGGNLTNFLQRADNVIHLKERMVKRGRLMDRWKNLGG
jgi:hypothetical protein